MPEPNIAGRGPVEVVLEPGEYYFCACGYSATQPFCDGSHKGRGFHPKYFKVEERESVLLCLCKRTQDPPYCDGSHNDLED